MKKDIQKERGAAVKRYLNGENPESICATLGRSTVWLYKWVKRYNAKNPSWCKSLSRKPHTNPLRTPKEIEEIVRMVRLNLYNQGLFCGDQAIRWELEELGVEPLPSLRTINRILKRHGLTHRRKRHYEPTGKLYPMLPSNLPNQTHQVDFVGPCYLKGPVRFYSLNVVDVNTKRCGLQPLLSRSGQNVIDGFWAVWKRMGIPKNVQMDNEMAFYGSPTHPRGMGPLIRLCLHNNVEPWFIPVSEPWRNGVIEKFNDHYKQKFLNKVTITAETELKQASLDFEHKHNNSYRYSKLCGQTPLRALSMIGSQLVFPNHEQAPRHPLKKPESGRYHLVRFIRSELRLNIFSELFTVPPELQYEYVVATIDVKEQKLKIFLHNNQVDELNYQLR
ncbi:MAG: DDE-type integrase/transposase/recombinase [Aliifodinibius sp.]|nr:transposase [Candidatus Bathyarchaeota archaeon]NIT61477.1 transposase [Fodinibius sp.]NIV16080.1 DDE-type integrase/transposase/recombinase [Fodinibius sp.]NIY30057.1 DDE-type integrase/transposase/recombinase [Fodinibius sp.]